MGRLLANLALADELKAMGLVQVGRFSWVETARQTKEILDKYAGV